MRKYNLKEYIRKIVIEEFKEAEEDVEEAFKDTLSIAYYIAKVAHYGQYRDNGSPYLVHPMSIFSKYRQLIAFNNEDFDPYELQEYQIPFYGVQEVCILHDVIEDWVATIEDIEQMYIDLGFKLYFQTYIKEPLLLITHNKDIDYETYIEEVLKHPTSALVKLLDLSDNSNIFGLKEFNDYEEERTHRYIKYQRMINDKYHYVEKFAQYRKELIDNY